MNASRRSTCGVPDLPGILWRTSLALLIASCCLGGCALERAPLVEPSEPLTQNGDGAVHAAGRAGTGGAATLDGGAGDGAAPDSGTVEAGPNDSEVDGALVDAVADAGCVPQQEVCDATDNDCDLLVDENSDGISTCPCDRHVFDEGTYLFCRQTETWEAARDVCQSLGYELSIIESEAEDDWLSLESDFSDDAWIGLTRVSSSLFQWTSGVTVWNGEDPVGYANFWGREPSNRAGRDCGQLLNSSGRWWMEQCSRDSPYICEAPAPE